MTYSPGALGRCVAQQLGHSSGDLAEPRLDGGREPERREQRVGGLHAALHRRDEDVQLA